MSVYVRTCMVELQQYLGKRGGGGRCGEIGSSYRKTILDIEECGEMKEMKGVLVAIYTSTGPCGHLHIDWPLWPSPHRLALVAISTSISAQHTVFMLHIRHITF